MVSGVPLVFVSSIGNSLVSDVYRVLVSGTQTHAYVGSILGSILGSFLLSSTVGLDSGVALC